jgi:hypothetical protein
VSDTCKRWVRVGVACSALAALSIAVVARTVGPARASEGPFSGIGAVAGVASGEDVLDGDTANRLRRANAAGHAKTVLGSQLLEEARMLPTAVHGRRLYLIPTEAGKFCLFLEGRAEACGEPLSKARAVVLVATDDDGPGGTGPTVFGIALDDVRTVSFAANGQRYFVPIHQNAFVFEGTPDMNVADVSAPLVTFSDGSTAGVG